jgi:histidinol-phosphatase
MTAELRGLLDFAAEMAWQAGKITLRYFQSGVGVDQKADDSPVTIADHEAEAFMRAVIGKNFPAHAIIGEEEGRSGAADAEYRWVLDPIDGTRSFIRGVPLYGVLVGLLRGDEPVLGVIHLPALNETVYAADGLGCYWNGRACRVSQVDRLDQALLTGTIAHGYERHGKAAGFKALQERTALFRTWGDCYAYALVATGRAEIALDPAMSLWDAAALLPILREAGGSYSDWQGNPTVHNQEGLATNGLLLDSVLGILRQAQ